MIRVKDYGTVFKFVKVMPRILWPLFSGTRCITITRRVWLKARPVISSRRTQSWQHSSSMFSTPCSLCLVVIMPKS